MVINESLIQAEVYDMGARLLGIASVDLPELTFMTAEVSGFGVAGKLEVPVTGATDSLELKLQWRTLYQPAVKMLKHGAVSLSLRAALQNYDASKGEVKIVPLRIDVRGRVKSATLGSLKPAEAMENETTIELDYLKIIVDGKTTAEVDKYNYKYRLDNLDYLSDVRKAVGL